MKAKLTQLTGPGVKGLEHCPPIYHVDFEAEEFTQLLADPVGAMKEMGYDVKRVDITLGRWDDSWNHESKTWVARATTRLPIDTATSGERAKKPQPRPKACCYVDGDKMICHVH